MASKFWVGGISGVLAAAGVLLFAARLRGERELEVAVAPAVVPGDRPQAQESQSRGHLGVLVAGESVDVSPRLEGRVERVHVQVGDAVKRGDVLATLEVSTLERALAVAEAELQSARADLQVAELSLVEAETRLRRREEPRQLSTGAISEEELTTARHEQRMAAARRDGAQARVEERQARAAQVRQQLADALIRAPFDGVVANRYVNRGALVRPGQALIHLLQSGTPQVRFALPEEEARRVMAGQRVLVLVPEEQLSLQGRVAHLSPEVDAASRMVHAIADLEQKAVARGLPTGTLVRVAVHSGEALAGETVTPSLGKLTP